MLSTRLIGEAKSADLGLAAMLECPAAALAAMQPGDSLVIVRLDRLARSLWELLEITADLEERSIALRVLTQGIDTSTPTGRGLFGMLTAIAQFERDLAAERLAESIRHRKAVSGAGRAQGPPSSQWVSGFSE